MREVFLDGSPAAIAALTSALRAALDGTGPAVLPLGDARLRSALALDSPVAPDVAVVVATSGSTGNAKGVLLSAAALRASVAATVARLGGPGRWLLALPAQHIAGIQVLVRSLLAGYEPEVMPTGTGFRSKVFTEAASSLLGAAGSGPVYTSLVPTQLTRLLADGGDGLSALRSFDAVLLGGAATPGPLLVRAFDAGVRVVTTYGMTETAGGCVYDGVPLSGVRVRIGAGERIELAGPMLASGYLGRPSDPAFAGGWFRTDDLGRVHRDGSLEVLGRADDVINTGGLKVSAAVVETVLAAQPGVAEVCVVGVPDAEWGQVVVAAVVPASAGSPPDARALSEAVRVSLGTAAIPREIHFMGALPLRGPGKVDRAAVVSVVSAPRGPAS
jgi:O-succinylbenzoic acid--CoA ligase